MQMRYGKLGVLGQQELAMGAIAADGTRAVGRAYRNFAQTSDGEVRALLQVAQDNRDSDV